MDNDRIIRNDLRLIRIGRKPLEILMVKQTGNVPSPRISATLNFYESLNILLLFGGKNDRLEKVYMDLYLFDLELYIWVKVNLFDQVPRERGEHNAVIHNDKLLIFGGISTKSYIGSDFSVINLSNFFYLYLDLWENKRKYWVCFDTSRKRKIEDF